MNDYYNGYYYPNYTSYTNPNMMRSAVGMNYGIPTATNAFRTTPLVGGATRSPGLLARLTGGSAAASAIPNATSGLGVAGGAAAKTFSWSGLLNGASKTLGVINQAIPVVYQVRPIWNNAKTMFRVMKAVNSDNKQTNSNTAQTTSTKTTTEQTTNNNASDNKKDGNGMPTFFQ